MLFFSYQIVILWQLLRSRLVLYIDVRDDRQAVRVSTYSPLMQLREQTLHTADLSMHVLDTRVFRNTKFFAFKQLDGQTFLAPLADAFCKDYRSLQLALNNNEPEQDIVEFVNAFEEEKRQQSK